MVEGEVDDDSRAALEGLARRGALVFVVPRDGGYVNIHNIVHSLRRGIREGLQGVEIEGWRTHWHPVYRRCDPRMRFCHLVFRFWIGG